jgi:membrane-associated protease RseP (regulator of RpoE activity)
MNDKHKTILRHSGLFIGTFITTTLAGADLCFQQSLILYREDSIGINSNFTWEHFAMGMQFSIPLLLFLTCHEFGHYFAALYHKVKSSLPYYIPVPPVPMFNIGTLGAVIRIQSRPYSTKQFFDIGIAGPIAGFVMSLLILFYGFTTLPPAEHIFEIHPEYKQYGLQYADHVYEKEFYEKELADKKVQGTIDVFVGKNLAYIFFERYVADSSRVPNVHEVIHYPVLFAGLISLLFTALNLFPIGQLDGGQVSYGLFGDKLHRRIGSVAFVVLLFYSGLGLEYIGPRMSNNALLITIPIYLFGMFIALSGLRMSRRDTAMYAVVMFAVHFILARLFPTLVGYSGWLIFAVVIGAVVGVKHPTAVIEQPLDSRRVALGWLALIIFILCFSPAPIDMKIFMAPQ